MRPLIRTACFGLSLLGMALFSGVALADGRYEHHEHHERYEHYEHHRHHQPEAQIFVWNDPSPAIVPVSPIPMGVVYRDRYGRWCQNVPVSPVSSWPVQTMCRDPWGRWVAVW